ncbi:MAG: hypothetical protein UR94_C0004G0052 [Parcubacteria group bacterium GW2011_GWA2_36_10]|nr:MAG: hypothetical protein UR94_C0004G0052 [Parcubacteria group bacterium GW2011_GWA2_36_10]
MSTKYTVLVEAFAQRHFIKKFEKKYKQAWNITWRAMLEQWKRMDLLLTTSVAETIIDVENLKIIKTEFRVAGTKQSRKGSGNRCIVAVDKKTCVVNVLLVYHKDDLGHGHETAQWQKIIRDNYSQYQNLF